MNDRQIKMIQTSRQLWKLISPSGCIIKDNIMIYSRREAEEYANAYISSFIGWSCEIIPIKGEKHEND